MEEIDFTWPKELLEARNSLLPFLKSEEQKGNDACLIGNKLYVNGKLFKIFTKGKVSEPRAARS